MEILAGGRRFDRQLKYVYVIWEKEDAILKPEMPKDPNIITSLATLHAYLEEAYNSTRATTQVHREKQALCQCMCDLHYFDS